MAKQTILKRVKNRLKSAIWGVLLPILGLFAVFFIFNPARASGALVEDYVQVTGTSFSTSTIDLTWDKGTAGGMYNQGVYLAIGTSSLAMPFFYNFQLGGQSWYLANSVSYQDFRYGGITGNLTTENGCALGGEYYSIASSTGNTASFNKIWDGTTSTQISVADIENGTPIYAVLVTWTHGVETCSTMGSDLTIQDYQYLGDFNGDGIGIISPTENATTTSSGWPLGWFIQNNVPGSTITGVSIYPSLSSNPSVQTQTAQVPETGLVNMPDNFVYTPTAYTATAFAKNSAGTILATSSPVHFYVYLQEDVSTSTDYSACDTGESGWFGRSFCRAMVFLFVPSDYALKKYEGLIDDAEQVPPFVYLSEISDALTISATTTEEAISSSTIEAFSNVFDPLKAGVKILLWFLFAFWAIRALRHIQA